MKQTAKRILCLSAVVATICMLLHPTPVKAVAVGITLGALEDGTLIARNNTNQEAIELHGNTDWYWYMGVYDENDDFVFGYNMGDGEDIWEYNWIELLDDHDESLLNAGVDGGLAPGNYRIEANVYDSDAGEDVFDAPGELTVTYTKQYTVYLDPDNGDPTATLTGVVGTALAWPTVPTKDGQFFTGWYVTKIMYPDGTTVVIPEEQRNQFPIDATTWATETAQADKNIQIWLIAGWSPEPTILDGANQTYNVGVEDGLTVRCSGAFAKFSELQIDDKKVDKENYTVKEGSTIVTVKASYLATLSVGSHTMTFVYTDGSKVSTTFTIAKSGSTSDSTTAAATTAAAKAAAPKTGDDASPVSALALLGLAAAGVLLSSKKVRK